MREGVCFREPWHWELIFGSLAKIQMIHFLRLCWGSLTEISFCLGLIRFRGFCRTLLFQLPDSELIVFCNLKENIVIFWLHIAVKWKKWMYFSQWKNCFFFSVSNVLAVPISFDIFEVYDHFLNKAKNKPFVVCKLLK